MTDVFVVLFMMAGAVAMLVLVIRPHLLINMWESQLREIGRGDRIHYVQHPLFIRITAILMLIGALGAAARVIWDAFA
jgi:hypothetical protein